MDPDETLRRIRELINREGVLDILEQEELRDLFEALDDWLSQGGFLPAAWRYVPGS